MNLGGDRDHSGHKGFCLSAMVDILCAVLSGGKWGPTVGALIPHLCPSNLCASRPAETLEFRRADGFTTNKLQAMFAGDGDAASNGHADKAQEQDDDEEESTGIVSPSWHRTQLRDAILAAAEPWLSGALSAGSGSLLRGDADRRIPRTFQVQGDRKAVQPAAAFASS